MTNKDLIEKWEYHALKGTARQVTPLLEMFSQCLGDRGNGIAFCVRGAERNREVNGETPQNTSILGLDPDNACYELINGAPMFVGIIVPFSSSIPK